MTNTKVKLTHYQEMIQWTLGELKLVADPRHVEAYMRLEFETLDDISRRQFKEGVLDAVEEINEDGIGAAEELAQSYGL